MITPSNSLDEEDDLPEETPEALRGIAERLQNAMKELFAARAEADEFSKSAHLSGEDERVLSEATRPDINLPTTTESTRANLDRRLYLPAPEGWQVRVKSGLREHCFYQTPGEDWFHTLVDGELYLQNGAEKICLNCAHRRGVLTDDRLFWQSGRRASCRPDNTSSFYSNPLNRKAEMTHPLESLIRDQYVVDDIRNSLSI